MKATAEHQRDGTYRPHRHDDRADLVYPKGPPAPPAGIDGHEKWLWQLVTENVPERVISPADGAALLVLCSWWSHWRQLEDEVKNAPISKRYKLLVELSMVAKRVTEGLNSFGLNPAARTRLRVQGKPGKKAGSLAKLLEMKTQRPSRN